jgi:hypothetical protein
MAHQFHVEFASPGAARAAADRLQALRCDGRQALAVESSGTRVFAWCAMTSAVESSMRIDTRFDGAERAEYFFSLFLKVDGIKSGMHHPDGLFWIRRPAMDHRAFEEPVALDLVAPTLLAELGIERPQTMRQDLVPHLSSRREAPHRSAAEMSHRMSA